MAAAVSMELLDALWPRSWGSTIRRNVLISGSRGVGKSGQVKVLLCMV
jgi:hypothetical protein